MPRGRRRKRSDSVLFKSAEWIGWALGGLEREIAETRERLALLNVAGRQAARPRRRCGKARRRGCSGCELIDADGAGAQARATCPPKDASASRK